LLEKAKKVEDKIPKKNLILKAYNIFMPNWNRASVTQGAAEMAYFILLSLIPILLVVANIIPLLPMETAEVLNLAQNIIPADIYSIIEPTLVGYLQSGSGGAITIGVIAAIWSASKIVTSLRNVLNEVYGAVDTQNFIISRILSMVIMLGIIIVIGLTIFLFIFGEQILLLVQSILGMQLPFISQFLALRWVVLMALLLGVFLIIYHFVPDHNLSFKYAVPGAIFSTVGSLLLSQFFSVYISFAGGDAAANATLGTFIILMLFLYLSSIILLIGGLLNVVVFEWQNNVSVVDYEKSLQKEEQLENTDWKGYPTEEDTVILRRKLFKVNTLKQEEIEERKDEESKIESENGE